MDTQPVGLRKPHELTCRKIGEPNTIRYIGREPDPSESNAPKSPVSRAPKPYFTCGRAVPARTMNGCTAPRRGLDFRRASLRMIVFGGVRGPDRRP